MWIAGSRRPPKPRTRAAAPVTVNTAGVSAHAPAPAADLPPRLSAAVRLPARPFRGLDLLESWVGTAGRAPVLAPPPSALAANKEGPHTYGCVSVPVTDPAVLTTLKRVQAALAPADVVELETDPHVTVRYGLHDEGVTTLAGVKTLLSGYGPVSYAVAGLSLFRGPDADVLKFDVKSSDLYNLYRRLGNIPNTTTHPVYRPHLTVAYLKPGAGDAYVGLAPGHETGVLTAEAVNYAGTDGAPTPIPLTHLNTVPTPAVNWSLKQPRAADGKFGKGATPTPSASPAPASAHKETAGGTKYEDRSSADRHEMGFEAAGHKYTFFAAKHHDPNHPDNWIVAFTRDNEAGSTTKLTGEAGSGAVKVMRSVGGLLDHFVTTQQPARFKFSADSKEPSRVRLYDRASSMIAERNGYDMKRADSNVLGATYTFTKKKPVTGNAAGKTFEEEWDDWVKTEGITGNDVGRDTGGQFAAGGGGGAKAGSDWLARKPGDPAPPPETPPAPAAPTAAVNPSAPVVPGGKPPDPKKQAGTVQASKAGGADALTKRQAGLTARGVGSAAGTPADKPPTPPPVKNADTQPRAADGRWAGHSLEKQPVESGSASYDLKVHGRAAGGVTLTEPNRADHSAAARYFPHLITAGHSVGSIEGVFLPKEHRGKGLGKAVYTAAMAAHGADWYYGGRMTADASRVYDSLAASGHAEVHKSGGGPNGGAGPHLIRLTAKGRTAAGELTVNSPAAVSAPDDGAWTTVTGFLANEIKHKAHGPGGGQFAAEAGGGGTAPTGGGHAEAAPGGAPAHAAPAAAGAHAVPSTAPAGGGAHPTPAAAPTGPTHTTKTAPPGHESLGAVRTGAAGGHGEGRSITGAKENAAAGDKRRIVDRTTTHEGVKKDKAGDLTPAECDKVISKHDGMTQVGTNGPNGRLPNESRPALSDHEAGALQKYSYKNDGPMNGRLRGKADWKTLRDDQGNAAGTVPYPDHFYDRMEHHLDSAMAKAPVMKTPVTVVRGMPMKDPAQLKDFTDKMAHSLKTGEPMQFGGYMSTATTGGVMQKMFGSPTDSIPKNFRGNLECVITAHHGLDMSPHSQLPGEKEFLLPKNPKFKITKIENKNGNYKVHMEQIVDHPAPAAGGKK